MQKFDFSNLDLPKLEMPDIDFGEIMTVKLSVAEIKALSDDELLAVLNRESGLEGIIPLPLQLAITSELMARHAERIAKPHWSVTPQFWLGLVAAIAGCIAAYPVVFPPQQKPVAPIVTHGQAKPDIHNSLSSFLLPQLSPKSKLHPSKSNAQAQPSIP